MTRTRAQKARAKATRGYRGGSQVSARPRVTQVMPVAKSVILAPRRTRSRRAKVTGSATGESSLSFRTGTGRQFARSLRDPWVGSACVPDGSRNTGCFTLKGVQQLATGAGSAVGAFLAFDPSNFMTVDSGSANPTFTFPGVNLWTPAPNLATIAALYNKFRPVSGSVRLSFTGNAVNSQGTMVAALIPANTGPNQFNGGTISTVAALTPNVRYGSTKAPLTVTWQPEDAEDFSFKGTAGANRALATANLSPVLFVGATGLATAGNGLVNVEYVLHFEGNYNQGALQVGADHEQPTPETSWYEKTMHFINAWAPVVVGYLNRDPLAPEPPRGGYLRIGPIGRV